MFIIFISRLGHNKVGIQDLDILENVICKEKASIKQHSYYFGTIESVLRGALW